MSSLERVYQKAPSQANRQGAFFMTKQKNFVQECYPVGSTHKLPYALGGEAVAIVENFIVDVVRENVLGIAVKFTCGRRRHFSWIELNKIRAGIAPTLSEVVS